MVFHPGKVLSVFPSRGKAEAAAATVRFWDQNLHTVKVSDDIAAQLRKGDMVLVDYYPISEKMNRPRMIAVKRVEKADQKDVWESYQEFFRLKKRALLEKRRQEGMQAPPRSNVGIG